MKSKGGRAKKAQYTTTVMRIPTPIKAEVESLLREFYESLSDKPVTSIKSEEVEKPVTSIEVLNLPNHLYLILSRSQINTVEDLKRWSLQGLEAIYGLGQISILRINTALIEKGYEPIS